MPHVNLSVGSTFYQDAGRGAPTVVCVHGFCQSSAYWQPTLERVAAAGARGIALDLPGFGQSASAVGPYTMAHYADVIAELLDALDLETVVLAGSSMGGVIAQQVALRHPSRLDRLLLVATGAFTGDPDGAYKKATELEQVPWPDEVVHTAVNAFFHVPPPEPTLTRYREIYRMASPEAAVEALRSNASTNTFERLHEIAVPTMIVQGRNDRSRTPERGAAMCQRIPHCRLEVLEHSGHTPQIDEPDAFHDVALPFCSARPESLLGSANNRGRWLLVYASTRGLVEPAAPWLT
jgi:pimeloyl-ACP methyl ester carboxylesterase